MVTCFAINSGQSSPSGACNSLIHSAHKGISMRCEHGAIKYGDRHETRQTATACNCRLYLFAGTASANPGMTTLSVNMRLGPGTQHPVIVAVPGSQPATNVSCVSGAAWCDVVRASYRGWVSATYIQCYTTPTTAVPVATVYQRLPVVATCADERRDARVQYRVIPALGSLAGQGLVSSFTLQKQ